MILAHRLPIIHCVKGGYFVDAHGWHLQDPGDFIHDADRCVSQLALAKVEQRHHGGFFILVGIAGEDLGDEGFVLGSEFERYGRIVLGRVPVLN